MTPNRVTSHYFDGVAKRSADLLRIIDERLTSGNLLPSFSDVRDIFPEQDEASCRSYIMALAAKGSIKVHQSCRPVAISKRIGA